MFNSYILIPAATWAIAQVAKFAILAFKGRVDFRALYASGGMPSVHSAVVMSLATTALILSGSGSAVFGVTVILAAIVIYDSLNVRRVAGEQSVALNMVIGSLVRGKVKLDLPETKLREVLGHKPLEVLVGGVLGVVLAGLFNYDRITPVTNFLQGVPAVAEVITYGAIFAALIIAGFVVRFILNRRYPGSATMRRLTGRLLAATQMSGWIGLVLVGLQYERASYLAWRVWVLIALAAAVTWLVTIAATSWKAVPAGLKSEHAVARKLKWLTPKRKARKQKS